MRTAAVVLIFVASCECRSRPPKPVVTSTDSAAPAIKRTTPRTETRPTSPPSLPEAATAWTAAEKQNTAEAWDAAGDTYERERQACTANCLDAAYAVILARRNAIKAAPVKPPEGEEPAPLPPRVQDLVEAADEYIKRTDASDPDFVGLKFLAANALNQFRQPDAIERLEELLREHRNEANAEYAANMLLASLARMGRIAELKKWVAELLADAAFLEGKPELRQRLEMMTAQMTK
ncbi:MAG TPA: hypothetical protein VIU61_15665 [Kofleriaceae bacterium]